MDAISLFANIIAVVGAVRSAVNGVERLRNSRFAPQQLSDIRDELSNFQSVLSAVERIVTQQAAQHPEDTLFIRYLNDLLRKAKTQVAALNKAIDVNPVHDLEAKNEKLIKILWKGWFKQYELGALTGELQSIRQDLAAALTVLTASETSRIRSILREIVLSGQDVTTIVERFQTSSLNQLDSIQASVATLSFLAEQIQTKLRDSNAVSRISLSTTSRSHLEAKSRASMLSPAPVIIDPPPLEAHCNGLFMCHCHKPLKFSSPRWAESLVGVILLSWSGVLRRPICSEKLCQKSKTNMLRLQYHFPRWFIRRVIHVQHRFMSVEGHVIHIKTPRIVPSTSQLFLITRTGNVSKMQFLFSEGLASPFDVNLHGYSSLTYAGNSQQVEACKFLLEQNADPKLKDIRSSAPINNVWLMVLTEPKKPVTQAMKTLFDPYMDPVEDLQDYGFNAIHQIVLGLSRLNLEDQLRLSTSGMDERCSLGRTPLSWAVMSGNQEAAKTLLKYGAEMDTMDKSSRNVFLYAVKLPDTDMLKLLLRTAYERMKGFQPSLSSDTAREPSDDTDYGPRVLPSINRMLDKIGERGDGGENPLIRSIVGDKISHAKLLIKYGANPNLPEEIALLPNHPSSPILQAVEYNAHRILKLLLQKGAKRDVLDPDGMGLLHLAGGIGDLRTIEILTEANMCCLRIGEPSKYGRTPLQEFDEGSPPFCPHDNGATRLLHRTAFLRLFESARPSDSEHVCTVNGYKGIPLSMWMMCLLIQTIDIFFEVPSFSKIINS